MITQGRCSKHGSRICAREQNVGRRSGDGFSRIIGQRRNNINTNTNTNKRSTNGANRNNASGRISTRIQNRTLEKQKTKRAVITSPKTERQLRRKLWDKIKQSKDKLFFISRQRNSGKELDKWFLVQVDKEETEESKAKKMANTMSDTTSTITWNQRNK
jgi:hypothetical protein